MVMKNPFPNRVVAQTPHLPMHRHDGRSACPGTILLAIALCLCTPTPAKPITLETEQVPTWSKQDMDFFLHRSMGTEVIPEPVLRTFLQIYPELFPTSDLSHLGLIPDPEFGWSIGFSRRPVKYLGNLSAVGINCASCHVAQITSRSKSEPIRILGTTSHFDVEAFFGSVLAATFKTSDPANMKKFLAVYLNAEPKAFDAAWQSQEHKILATNQRRSVRRERDRAWRTA
jgi:hypothetical protein